MQFGTKIVVAVALLAGLSSSFGTAHAQEYVVAQPTANYYTNGAADQSTAVMYVAPVPVPQWVGHTMYTYQPLYPHEYMYLHKHRYHNYYDGGRGLNRTKVHYGISASQVFQNIGNHFKLPRP